MIELQMIGTIVDNPTEKGCNGRRMVKFTVCERTERNGKEVQTFVECVKYMDEGEKAPCKGQTVWFRAFPYIAGQSGCINALIDVIETMHTNAGETIEPQAIGAPIYDREQIRAIELMQQAGFEPTELKLKA